MNIWSMALTPRLVILVEMSSFHLPNEAAEARGSLAHAYCSNLIIRRMEIILAHTSLSCCGTPDPNKFTPDSIPSLKLCYINSFFYKDFISIHLRDKERAQPGGGKGREEGERE